MAGEGTVAKGKIPTHQFISWNMGLIVWLKKNPDGLLGCSQQNLNRAIFRLLKSSYILGQTFVLEIAGDKKFWGEFSIAFGI